MATQKYPRCPPDDPFMKGHGAKFDRKKESTIAALLGSRNHEEAAISAGISLKTLKRWLRIPEFLEEYRRARWEVAEQGYARAQQNTGLAVAVLLKLMAAESTPASSRIRAALGVVDIARAGLDFDIETRVAALEQAAEVSKQSR